MERAALAIGLLTTAALSTGCAALDCIYGGDYFQVTLPDDSTPVHAAPTDGDSPGICDQGKIYGHAWQTGTGS